MQNDRRHFLVAGAAGMTTLLAPNISLACFCRRRRRASIGICAAPPPSHPADHGFTGGPGTDESLLASNYPACPIWAPQPPLIANPSSISPKVAQTFKVFGEGLHAWGLAGGSFNPSVTDYYHSTAVTWVVCGGVSTATGSGAYDSLTFSASETGSSSGLKSVLLITVTLSPKPHDQGWKLCLPQNWLSQQVTYST
jgi:hypothetical protein